MRPAAAQPRSTNRFWPLPIAPARGVLSFAEIIIIAVCIVLAFVVSERYHLDILIRTFLWCGLALAWNIAGGYTGLISFGHAAFFGIGAYTSTILLVSFDLSPWIGMWAGACLAGATAALLTAICARLRGPFFILSTLAFGEVIRIGALNWRALTGGSEGLEISPLASLTGMVFKGQGGYLALMLAYMLALFALSKWIERSRFGYYLFATRDDEDAAAAIGIDPTRMRIWAMTLSAALAGMGGTLFAQYFLYLDPTHVISPEISFQFALICALGGIGTAIGPILGALVIVPLSEFLRAWLSGAASGLHLVIYGFAVIVVVLYFPGGLAGALTRTIEHARRTTALHLRRRIP
jgi:branched-chain amino acid transport system permease protein